jgi:hypothetical protein
VLFRSGPPPLAPGEDLVTQFRLASVGRRLGIEGTSHVVVRGFVDTDVGWYASAVLDIGQTTPVDAPAAPAPRPEATPPSAAPEPVTADPTPPLPNPLAVLPACTVLSSTGMPPRAGEEWDVAFFRAEVVLSCKGHRNIHVPYAEMYALEIGGPAVRRRRSHLVASTWVRPRAAQGELIDAALGMLTQRSEDDVVIGLKTRGDELLLHTVQPLPDGLLEREAELKRNIAGTYVVVPTIFLIIAVIGGLCVALVSGNVWLGVAVLAFVALRFGPWVLVPLGLARLGLFSGFRRRRNSQP